MGLGIIHEIKLATSHMPYLCHRTTAAFQLPNESHVIPATSSPEMIDDLRHGLCGEVQHTNTVFLHSLATSSIESSHDGLAAVFPLYLYAERMQSE